MNNETKDLITRSGVKAAAVTHQTVAQVPDPLRPALAARW